MMGAGKSAVGRALAAHLGWSWVDTDQVVEQQTGLSIAGLFASEGESGFREAEARVVAGLAGGRGPVLVSLGGGSVLSPQNRGAMRALGTVVWLRAQPATLAARVGDGASRPLLQSPASLERLAAEREPLYLEVADFVVDVDDRTVDQVVAEVLRQTQLPAN
jgi:shikimate kinase